jgi:hypothetical protein
MKKASVFLSVFSLFVAGAMSVQAQIGIFETSTDIDGGQLGPAGSASYNAATGTYTVKGSGHDIWDARDDFHFLYKKWSGDFDVQARIAITGGTSAWIKGMIMARATLDPASINIGTRVRRDGQYSMQSRQTATTWDGTDGPLRVTNAAINGGLQRFVKRGDTFTCYYKLDGDANWTLIGNDANYDNRLSLPDVYYLGFAVTAHTGDVTDKTEVATGTFSQVSINRPSLIDTSLVTLQEGAGGYAGTSDTHIISWDGAENQLTRNADGTNGGIDGGSTEQPQNAGGHAYIEEGDYGGGSNDSKVILIKFDTSSVPAADARRLARAQIGLYFSYDRAGNSGGDGNGPVNPAAGNVSPHVINAQPILKAWMEGNGGATSGVDGDNAADNSGSVTWNSTGAQLWEAIGAEGPSDVGPVISSTFFDTIPGQWVWVDVTSAARGWIANPASNNGVKISQETDNVPENPATVYPIGSYNFASSENATASLRPQLALEFIDASSVGAEWSLYE